MQVHEEHMIVHGRQPLLGEMLKNTDLPPRNIASMIFLSFVSNFTLCMYLFNSTIMFRR
jgi:hypothetical protein